MNLIEPGSIGDTTSRRLVTPVRVEATLAAPLVGVPGNPLHLDGPVSWGAYLTYQGELPPRNPWWMVDFDLPLATWTAAPSRGDVDERLLAADGGSVWGWACSAATLRHARPTVATVRRLPDTQAMAHWTLARRHHLGLGPRRAVNGLHQATTAARAVWWALTTEITQLEALLDRVTHLGRVTRHGNGRVLDWSVTPDDAAHTCWQERALPDRSPSARPGGIRAPYYHRSRRMPVTRPNEGERLWR